MLFRRELAPGAAEQVALMESEQRRRQIEQQLALHQVLRHAISRSCARRLYHDLHKRCKAFSRGVITPVVFLPDRRGSSSNVSSSNSSKCFLPRCKCSSTNMGCQKLVTKTVV